MKKHSISLAVFPIVLASCSAAAMGLQAAPPQTEKKLAPRAIPGMAAPAKAEEIPLPPPRRFAMPKEEAPADVSGTARIVFIHRRGTFQPPQDDSKKQEPEVENGPARQAAPMEAPLAEGKFRIISQPRTVARDPSGAQAPPAASPRVAMANSRAKKK